VNNSVKETIAKTSLRLFSTKGFHGTSMRAISNAAKISLPTIYYYFKDKEELFEEVVANEFLLLHSRLRQEIQSSKKPQETYSQAVISVKKLNSYDKKILYMAMKVGFGFDGTGKAREKIVKWEQDRFKENFTFLETLDINKSIKDDFIALLVDLSEHLMQRIILLGEDIPDETIKKRFEIVFSLIQNK
jgi:AcrR family transcriptional regulator